MHECLIAGDLMFSTNSGCISIIYLAGYLELSPRHYARDWSTVGDVIMDKEDE